MTTQIKKIATLVLALAVATSASAANNNKDKEKENNGNHYGQIKKDTAQVSQPTSSVPEPATLALMGAGALAVGVAALKRRRAKNDKK